MALLLSSLWLPRKENQKCAKPPSNNNGGQDEISTLAKSCCCAFSHLMLTVWWCETLVSRHVTTASLLQRQWGSAGPVETSSHAEPLWREVNLPTALTQREVVMATGAGKPSLLPLGAGTLQVLHCGPPGAVWKQCGREACWSDPARTPSHQAWQCSPPCWRGTRRQLNWTTDSQKNDTFITRCIYEIEINYYPSIEVFLL